MWPTAGRAAGRPRARIACGKDSSCIMSRGMLQDTSGAREISYGQSHGTDIRAWRAASAFSLSDRADGRRGVSPQAPAGEPLGGHSQDTERTPRSVRAASSSSSGACAARRETRCPEHAPDQANDQALASGQAALGQRRVAAHPAPSGDLLTQPEALARGRCASGLPHPVERIAEVQVVGPVALTDALRCLPRLAHGGAQRFAAEQAAVEGAGEA